MEKKFKLARITTVPMNLYYPLRGQPSYMQSHGFDVLMISSDGKEMGDLLENEKCAHAVVPMTRLITPLRDLRSLYRMVKVFKKFRPDIVHAESPKAGLLAMIAGWICRVKVRIYTNAGLSMTAKKGFSLFLLESVEKIIYAFATNIWPNGRSTMEYIIEHKYTKAKKVQLIGNGSSNGIDTARFNKNYLSPSILEKIKKDIQYDPSNIYLLFAGRLVADKGITELMNVFLKLSENYPSLRMVLLGQYEKDLDPLPAHIEYEIGNNTKIIQISWTEQVEYYMALANYFVFPSYREGFPNVLLEAAAMDLPIVCSRIMGNIDIVKNEETGYIFERMDEASLAEKLTEALDNRARAKEMAMKLKEQVLRDYDRKLFWGDMLKQYRALLQQYAA